MNIDVVVPYFGATGGDVRIVAWHVKQGDFISAGSPLVTIETDKATEELPACQEGYIDQIMAQAGAEVPIGAVIAILRPGNNASGAAASVSGHSENISVLQSDGPIGLVSDGASVANKKRPLASPAARRLAREHNISLSELNSASNGGVIHLVDVEKALASGAMHAADASMRDNEPRQTQSTFREQPGRHSTAERGGVDHEQAQSGELQYLSHARRALVRRVTQSKSEIPHFYVTKTVDMSEAERARAWLIEAGDRVPAPKPTINDLIVRAAALALRAVPQLNVRFYDDSIEFLPSIDVGVVIGSDDSLIVPIVRNADQLDIYALAQKTKELKQRAANKALTTAELDGGSMSVSNLGMYGVEQFVAVINPLQVSILACGTIQQRPIVTNDSIAIRRVMTVTLSVDHRAADGIVAAGFLDVFQRYIEVPQLLLAGRQYGGEV